MCVLNLLFTVRAIDTDLTSEYSSLTICRDPDGRHSPLQVEKSGYKNDLLLGIRCQIYCRWVATGRYHLHQAKVCKPDCFC